MQAALHDHPMLVTGGSARRGFVVGYKVEIVLFVK